MNVKHESNDPLIHKFSIEVVKEDYAEKVNSELKKLRRTHQMPGFRVGHVPMDLIKRMFERELIVEKAFETAHEELYKIVQEEKIEYIFSPVLMDQESSLEITDEGTFNYVFDLVKYPQFELNYSEIPAIDYFQMTASEKDINDLVYGKQMELGSMSSPDTIEEKDDHITILISGDEEKEYSFILSTLTEATQESLMNKKINDVLENVNLRSYFTSEEQFLNTLKLDKTEFAGVEEYVQTIQIKSISRRLPAELNEEFFKEALPGVEINSEEDFRKEMAISYANQTQGYVDQYFFEEMAGELIKAVSIQFPEEHLKYFIKTNSKEKMSDEDIERDLPKYINSFKWELIESKIATDHGVNVTQEDMQQHIEDFLYKNYFRYFNREEVSERLAELAKKQLEDKTAARQVYDQLFNNKVIEAVKEKVTLNIIEGNLEDYYKYMGDKYQQKEQTAETKTEEPKEAKEEKKTEKAEKKAKVEKTETAKKTDKKEETKATEEKAAKPKAKKTPKTKQDE